MPNSTMINDQKEAESERILEVQRDIARMLTSNPKEMLSASSAFLCGWLARDNMEPKSA